MASYERSTPSPTVSPDDPEDPTPPEAQNINKIQLSRYDIEFEAITYENVGDYNNPSQLVSSSSINMNIPRISQLQVKPKDREDLIEICTLPNDSVIKLKYNNKFIPWSLIQFCNCQSQLLDIQVFRPHQNLKPKLSECFPSDNLIMEKVNRLESRISSLEESVDPICMDLKTEKDLQLLTKQISFLRKRLEEADQAEWMTKSF